MSFNLTKQTKPFILFTLAVALLGGVFYGGYRYWKSQQAVPEPPEPSVVEEPKPIPITEPTDNPNWNLYINKEYGFSVEYPAEWGTKAGNDLTFERVLTLSGLDSGYVFILVDKEPTLDVLSWSTKNWNILASEEGAFPRELNAVIAGLRSLVGYSPPGANGWASAFTILKKGEYIFVLVHKAAERGVPLLWGTYEHFLRTFEFENTENIPDKLPAFPMGF